MDGCVLAPANSVRLCLPAGDEVTVSLYGAQVLSWKTADGRERLYLSPNAILDGSGPIRGGIPVCFPQFNQRALGDQPLPKHGFARTLPWALQARSETPDRATARLVLTDGLATRTLWPHGFAANLDAVLTPGTLRVEFTVTNTGDLAWPFALALHSYFRAQNIGHLSLTGLSSQPYWDAVAHLSKPAHRQLQGADPIRFEGETDRVYAAAAGPLTLREPLSDDLRIEQSAGFTETVVWNPGAAVAATLADMPDDGFQYFVCVEAAKIDAPVSLAPGQTWSAWQSMTAQAASP
jgi:glucose-6-phosphate 1-epimerase